MTFAFSKKSDSAIADHPLGSLPREDLDMIAELVIRSGSLKDLGAAYGVSYPTIRARLDRVISRLQEAMAGRTPDPLSELLAGLVERGELTPSAALSIRQLARAGSGVSGAGPGAAFNHSKEASA